MRTFEQLTGPEQEAAVEYALTDLLRAILEEGLRFDDAKNGDDLQACIDAAFAKAERLQTPWFAGEYIMDARFDPGAGHILEADGLWPVAEQLRGMAQCDAEDTQYASDDDGPIARLTGTLVDGFKVRAV